MDFTERTVIDGKPATVCYLDAARMPTTPDKAAMMEVRFDNGDTMFAVVKPKAATATCMAKGAITSSTAFAATPT